MLPALTVRAATIGDVGSLTTIINVAFAVERRFVDRDRTDVDEIATYLEKGAFLIADGDDGHPEACVHVEIHGDRGYIGRTELPGFYHALSYTECGTAPFEDSKLTRPAHFILMTKHLT